MTGPVLAADLANLATSGWSITAADAVLAEHEIRWRTLDDASSAELEEWASQLLGAFAASSEQDRCEAVNALLAEGTSRAYLTTHDDLRPHLHFAADEDDVVARVKAVTAGGLAIFTVEAEGGRLGQCARESCQTVFVDTSRNGRRAYCSARCGNTDAVTRHRAQQREPARRDPQAGSARRRNEGVRVWGGAIEVP